jgi:hypothetical protein
MFLDSVNEKVLENLFFASQRLYRTAHLDSGLEEVRNDLGKMSMGTCAVVTAK